MDKISLLAQTLANKIDGSKIQVVPTQVINDQYDVSYDIIITVGYSQQVFCVCKEGDEYFWFKTY